MEIIIKQLKTFSPDITPTFNSLLKELNPNSRTLTDADAKEIIETSSNRLLVAREPAENKIVGMLTLIISNVPFAKKGFIEDVVVNKNYQGKGVGKKLMKFAIEQARAEGVRHLDLTSRPEKVEANKLYPSLGFKIRDTNVYRLEI